MQKFEGIIVSNKMNNTAVVQVTRKTVHKLYKRVSKKNKSYKVDTQGFNVLVGDFVEFFKIRPISKEKHFKISKIIKTEEPKAPVTVKAEIKVKKQVKKKEAK
ncbi:MAG: uS17 family ribosomal protein [Candidatus Levyibacteriota bacterium]